MRNIYIFMKVCLIKSENLFPRVLFARYYDTKKDITRKKTSEKRTTLTYEASIFLFGNGTININGKEYQIKKGYARFNNPGDQVFSSGDFKSLTVKFDFGEKNVLVKNEIISKIKEYFYVRIDLIPLFNEIISLFEKADDISKIKANQKLTELIVSFYENDLKEKEVPEKIKICLKYLEDNFSKKITLKDLGTLSGYSDLHLLRLFKQTLNFTPHEYLTEIRLKNAKKMIYDNPEMTIEDIAFNCGFNSESHFKQLFKKNFNETIGSFKKLSKNI